MDIPPPPFWRLYSEDGIQPAAPPPPKEDESYQHFGAKLFASLEPKSLVTLPKDQLLVHIAEDGGIDIDGESKRLVLMASDILAKALRLAAEIGLDDSRDAELEVEISTLLSELSKINRNVDMLCTVSKIQLAADSSESAASLCISEVAEAMSTVEELLARLR